MFLIRWSLALSGRLLAFGIFSLILDRLFLSRRYRPALLFALLVLIGLSFACGVGCLVRLLV